jgi:hypothetical protein
LCVGGDGGWSFAVRDKSSGLFWWSFDLENNRFADRPDRVFNDRDWQFRPMPREGLKSGLEVEILMINGWPLAVSVDSGRPIQYFDPVLREFINFYPDTPTPEPSPSNTPRPTAIPATVVPKPSPTLEQPSPTVTAMPTPEAQQVPPIRAGEVPSLGQIDRWCKGYFQLPKFPLITAMGIVEAIDSTNKTITINGTTYDASAVSELGVYEILDRDKFAQSYYGDDIFRYVPLAYSIETILPYIIGSHVAIYLGVDFGGNPKMNLLDVLCDAVRP